MVAIKILFYFFPSSCGGGYVVRGVGGRDCSSFLIIFFSILFFSYCSRRIAAGPEFLGRRWYRVRQVVVVGSGGGDLEVGVDGGKRGQPATWRYGASGFLNPAC